ncbi:MAG: thermonuclease family protein [Pseudomonadota bacterium]
MRRSHGETLRVRLHGIDAPEHGQAYGHAARRTLETLITKEPVAVEVIDVDRFGRSVAVVYQGERNLNLEMVRRGYAWWYRQYAKDDDTLRNAEEEAKEAQLGLWKDDNPRPPWDWRREAP